MTLPWRSDTTEDIAAEVDSRYETPGGAQNKVDVSQAYLLHLLKLAVTGLSDGSEAAIARHSTPYNITYDWLKDRLDATDVRLGVTPEMYGAVGDGITDDTLAVQQAFDNAEGKNLVFYNNYAVSMIVVKNVVDSVIDFNGHKLIALSTAPTDCVLKIQASFCTWFNIFVDVKYKENYKCGIHIVPEVENGIVTICPQYNNFFGITVSGAILGTVYGVYEDEISVSCPASENVFYGYKGYSLNRSFYVNQKGAYFTMVGCTFETNQGGWATVENPTRYADANSCCFRCDVGSVNIVASEIVKADTANGYGIYGRGINISNSTWEFGGVQGYITGNVIIRDNTSGFIGSGDLNYFKIAEDSVGQLLIENCTFRRPHGAEDSANTILFHSSSAPFFKVKLRNVNLTHTMFNSQFIKNIDFELENLRYAPHGIFSEESDGLNNVNDPAEYRIAKAEKMVDVSEKMTEIPLTAIKGRKNNWIVYNESGTNNAESVKRISTNLPSNYNGKYVLELQGADGWSGIRTPIFRVEEAESFCMTLVAQCTGSGTSTIAIRFLDENRSTLIDISYDNFTSNYRRYNYFCNVPTNAKYCYVRIANNNSQLTRFTDFRVYGVKHDDVTRASAAPTAGFWDKGEVVWNDLTTTTTYAGWVCKTEPSTFAPFGAIV